MTLLIVNDEAIIADAIRTEVAWDDYGINVVYTAYDAPSAKEIMLGTQADILLCDIEMPRENGLMLLRWVREQALETECVILTCHAKFTYAKEAMELGVQDYILLPVPYEEVGKTIYRVVRRIEKKKEEQLYIQYGKSSILDNKRERRNMEQTSRMELSQNLEEIVNYIRNHLTENELSVESIADYFHYHAIYLNRIFKKKKNISISQFIIDERMKMAALLLKEGNCNVNEVAELVGYTHYTNFFNMFKKTYKMSPMQYQETEKKHSKDVSDGNV